jgi:biopolymer transport protein ExbB/TolQ
MVPAQAVGRPLEQPTPLRWTKGGVVVGAILMTGPFWGLLGTGIGMARSFAAIETLKSPTPDDLSAGVEISLNATMMGLGAFVIGAAVLALSLVCGRKGQVES